VTAGYQAPEVSPAREPLRPSEAVGGLLAAAAIFLGVLSLGDISFTINGVHLAFRPVRVGAPAELLALVSAAMVGKQQRKLAAFAVAFCAVSWFIGMTIAVITEHPLY
jgi:hypothetical protein